ACKKEPRRGDGRQAGVKPLINMRKKKKPQRGDGTAAYPLSFRHSFGVLMGGRFHAGVTLSLHHLPVFCRTYSALFCCNLSPLWGLQSTRPYPELA
ncbi:hypothetical protein, partial [Hoylesella marshii]|uniref:hypothetical protein n=1 Tax=Hoylesella marshii TaxID=189722 RepID=UPI0028D167ED